VGFQRTPTDDDIRTVRSSPLPIRAELGGTSSCWTCSQYAALVGRPVIAAPGWRMSSPCSELIFPVRQLVPDRPEVWKQVVKRGCGGCVAKDEASVDGGGARDGAQQDWGSRGRWQRNVGEDTPD
jgi:hypothetical protein